MRVNHVKVGIVLSYVLMILDAIYGFIVTPILIKFAGTGDYGVYKTIASFTASVMILDLGLGDATIRYVSKYCSQKEEDKIPNFLAMIMVLAVVLSFLTAAVCFALSFLVGPLYGASFTNEQLGLAYKIFLVCSINVVTNIVANVFNGIISGLNKFAISRAISVTKILARIVLGIVVIVITKNILLFVCLDLAIVLLAVLFEICIIRFKFKVRIKLSKWDKALFAELTKFSLLLFAIAVAGQICNNLDNVIIGSICGPDYVAVYSVSLVIFVMFGSIACAVSGVMLPTITQILNEDDYQEKIVKLLIKVGRLQFILLAAASVGFAILGRDFISVWLGAGFEDAYLITLILIVPSMFEYCINTALSILKAKNLLGFRAFALILACVLNLITTIVLVKYWSYIGAAIGTSVTYLVCSLFMMNIYYSKKLKLPMGKIYLGILSKLWLCLLIAGGTLYIYSLFVNGTIYSLIGGIVVFCLVYSFCLLTFGLNREEKARLPILGKRFESKGIDK